LKGFLISGIGSHLLAGLVDVLVIERWWLSWSLSAVEVEAEASRNGSQSLTKFKMLILIATCKTLF